MAGLPSVGGMEVVNRDCVGRRAFRCGPGRDRSPARIDRWRVLGRGMRGHEVNNGGGM